MELLPHTFLFRFAVPVPYRPECPKRSRWPMGEAVPALPLFSALDQASSNVVFRAAWNENGFGVAAKVSGKSVQPFAPTNNAASGDGLQVWIDTRNTHGAHRAGRFCHRFAVLPAIGRGRSAKPGIVTVEIPRSRENAPPADLSRIRIAVEVKQDGYRVEAWFPSETLHGFDPEHSPRLGFHAVVKDSEIGDQSLTVGDEFPTDHDPSLWTTLELAHQ